jgi:hypothetical protein
LQDVDPSLAAGVREPGEPVAVDLRHIAVVALMARPGIANRDAPLTCRAVTSS